MLDKRDNVIFSNNDIVFVSEDSDHVTIISDDMGLNTMYLHNINFDDDTARYVKTGKQIIIACKHNIQQDGAFDASRKMEKRNKIIFDW